MYDIHPNSEFKNYKISSIRGDEKKKKIEKESGNIELLLQN